jgi:hypothetical protein
MQPRPWLLNVKAQELQHLERCHLGSTVTGICFTAN